MKKKVKQNRSILDNDHHLIANDLIYFFSRSSLEDGYNNFKTNENSTWPSFIIENEKKTLKAIATMRPGERTEARMTLAEINTVQEKMVELVEKMSDTCCDLWDIAVWKYIKYAKSPTDMLSISATEILELRGLPPRSEYKEAVARDMEILSNLWINVVDMERVEIYEDKNGRKRKRKSKWRGRSKALVVTSEFGSVKQDKLTPSKWMFRLGDIYGPTLLKESKSFALLASKVLTYHATRDIMLKRLGRYLSFSWRCRSYKGAYTVPFRLETLLVKGAKVAVNQNSPRRIFERFEQAMTRLVDDGVVGAWQWHEDDYDISVLDSGKGWWKKVLLWRCILEPPQIILDQYFRIQAEEPTTLEEFSDDLCSQLREARIKLKISQTRLAEVLEVSPLYISYLERGVRTAGPKLKRRINKWLKEQ